MRWNRAILLALVVIALVATAWVLREHGRVAWLPECQFHRLTGRHCPGCGMTRATFAALHGQIGHAFRCNPLGMVLLPLTIVGLALELSGWVRAKPPRWRLSLGRYGGWVIFWAVLGFWLFRNLPWWPFTLLAPP
jgi:hypothetical protein